MINNSLKWFTASESEQQVLEQQNRDYANQLSLKPKDGLWYQEGSDDPFYTINKWQAVDYIVNAMKSNSSNWSEGRTDLEDANVRMASYIEDLSGQKVWKDENGVWWIGNDKLYDSYGTYHTGGIVGDKGSIKDNEMFALLEEGELVLNQGKKDAAYKYVDIATYMMKKFGASIDNLSATSSITPQMLANSMGNLGDKSGGTLANILGKSSNIIIESIEVTAPIQVLQKLDEDDIREHSRMIGDISAKYIQEGFTRKGIVPTTTLF